MTAETDVDRMLDAVDAKTAGSLTKQWFARSIETVLEMLRRAVSSDFVAGLSPEPTSAELDALQQRVRELPSWSSASAEDAARLRACMKALWLCRSAGREIEATKSSSDEAMRALAKRLAHTAVSVAAWLDIFDGAEATPPSRSKRALVEAERERADIAATSSAPR